MQKLHPQNRIETEIALGIKNNRYKANSEIGNIQESQCDLCAKWLDGNKVKRFLLFKKTINGYFPKWFLCKHCGEKKHLQFYI